MRKSCLVLVLLLAAVSLVQALPGQYFKATAKSLSNFHARPAPAIALVGSLKTVTSVWFTSNGAPTHVSLQGEILTWAANCLPNDTLQWEIWIDTNHNGLFDSTGANQDTYFAGYSVANGDTLSQQGLPDTTAVTDNEIVAAMKNGFAPALYWFKAVSLVDGSSAFDSVRVTTMVSPWATVSGHVHVPGDSALQGNLWLEADLYTGGDGGGPGTFWAALTDSFGNYTINMDNTYLDTLWGIGYLSDIVAVSGVYAAPGDTIIRVTGGDYTGVNFAYTAATDSITGEVIDELGMPLSMAVYVYAQQGNLQKEIQTSGSHYQLFFTTADTGTWRLGCYMGEGAPYMSPSQVELQPAGSGHLVHDFIAYRATDAITGTVTEQGGIPSQVYRIQAWSDSLQISAQALTDPSTGVYTLMVSDSSSYNVGISTWDNEYPIPDGWTAIPIGYSNVNPPASGKNFDLSPATTFITGQITQDVGDAQPIDYGQTWVQASPIYGGSQFQSQPNMAGQYSIPVAPDSYNVWIGSAGFLFTPSQYQNVGVIQDETILNKNFIANYGHCRVEVNLIGYPADYTNWMSASDELSWPNAYQANVEVNNSGNYNLYICNSTGWNVWAPNATGYNVSPGNYNIGDITHSDTYRGVYTFTYMPTGVEGEPKDRPMPTVFKLSQNSPNPSSGRTRIDYQLPQTAGVSLVIYNILGQEVRRYNLGSQQPGYYSVDWDGRDENGRTAVAGVYLYRLQAGGDKAIRRMMVLR